MIERRVLIVDDDATVRSALHDALGTAGFVVDVADGAISALAMVGACKPGIVVSDVRMPDLGGLELLRELRTRAPEVDVVLMTAFDDMPTVVEAMKQGAVEFLVKPLDLDELQRTLERVFDDREVRGRPHRAAAPVADASSLVGRDPRMIDI